MAGRQIVVDIIGDASKFTRATKEATGSATKLGTLFGSGLGLGAGIASFNLMGDAVSKTTEYLTDAVQMAKEEEVGIKRLEASLKANVKGWDGNTEAIEANISSMVRSTGFSDGDMRDSLSALVAATGNVEDAFKLQATAMDLARFKGIDLVTASKALVKVEAGQYRALKELGIVLKAGATQTEALAAVQKVAGGQMAAYMETAAGKSEVLKNRLEDLQEEVGFRLLPALTTATEGLLNFMDAMDTSVPMETEDRLKGVVDVLNVLNPAMWAGNIAAGAWGDAQEKAAEQAGAAAGEAARAWDTGSERIMTAMANTADASDDAKDEIVGDNRRILRSYADLADYLLGKYNDDYDTAMGIQEARSDLHNAKSDEDRAEAYADLAELGDLSEKDYKQWVSVLERLAKGTKGKVHEAYMAAIADIRALQVAASKAITVRVNYLSSRTGTGHQARAAGGAASGLTWVGEQGPELVDLPTGSFVHNNTDSRRMAGSGSGAITINVQSPVVTPGSAEAIAAAIGPYLTRSMQRTGAIGRPV